MNKGINKGIEIPLYTIRLEAGRGLITEPLEFFSLESDATEHVSMYERLGFKAFVQQENTIVDITI